jgi:hypothetical protein
LFRNLLKILWKSPRRLLEERILRMTWKPTLLPSKLSSVIFKMYAMLTNR